MEKKDLYKASSTSELLGMIENIGYATNGKSVEQIINSGKKILDLAELMVIEGDEEAAYVLYGRYMKILSTLQARSDYSTQKELIEKMLGGNAEQQKIMEKMERLSDSLKDRYDQRKLDLESKKSAPSSGQVSTSPSMDDIKDPSEDDNASLEAHEEKNLSQSELLERKELLIIKTIQNNKELIRLENDHMSIEADNENHETLPPHRDLLSKIYELHAKQNDVELELETIEEKLKIVKNDPVKPSGGFF